MVAGPPTRPTTPQGIASRVVAPQRIGGCRPGGGVAGGELLAESVDRPVSDRLDPPLPDLARSGIIQVEPPRGGWVKPPTGRAPAPAAEPPPRRRATPPRRPGAGAPQGGGQPEGGAGTVVVVHRRPPRQPVEAATPAAVPPVPPARP